MKVFLNMLFLIVPFLAFAQWSDDFSDGDFSNNPSWEGTVSHFTVNPTFQLQTDVTGANTSYLSTPHLLTNLDNIEWRFYAKMTFAGSASNYVRIYLTADNPDLTAAMNGYYIKLGEALTTDAVRLYKLVNGVSTQICASPNGTIATSANIGVRVLRSSLGDWQLLVDFTGGENYVLQSTANDPSTLLETHFGFLAKYTSGNSKKVFFDNVFVGPEFVDTTPPSLISTTIISSSEVDLLFSEDLEEISIQDIANYSFNPTLNLVSATRDAINLSKVKLIFNMPFTNGTTYQFDILNVTDLTNNSASVSGNFTYLVSEVPIPGDVIINEFMADPSPVVGLPELEFVEIYNKSAKYFDLTGWKLGDNASDGTITGGWLAPGEYKVLCAATSVSQFPNSIAVTSFPNLNNGTDDVVVKDQTGLILDKITYFDTWYKDDVKKQGGYTLERINPNHPCTDANNWIASTDLNGGTPGVQNSVYDIAPDNSLIQITESKVIIPNGLELYFSKKLDSLSVFNASHTFNPTLTVDAISVNESNPKKITYSFQENIVASQSYQFTINNIQDCWSNSNVVNGQFILADIPLPGDILINEFMAIPTPSVGLPELEFVEIYNKSAKHFDMTGWKLGDNLSDGTITGGWLAPGEYKVLCASTSVAQFPWSIAVTSFPNLNNGTDDVVIKDQTGLILDKITYFDTWYKDDVKKQGGYTLERINPNHPCSDGNNWIASNDLNGGTPGIQNSVYEVNPDTTFLLLTEIKIIEPNGLEVRFNKGLDSTSIFNANHSFNPNLTVDLITVTESYPRKVTYTFQENIVASQLYQFTISNLQDCWTNSSNVNGQFILADIPMAGDVIITEFMADPSPAIGLPELEFVEIYNKSAKYFNLTGWKLGDNATDGTIIGGFLAPGEYKVLCAASSVPQFPGSNAVTSFPSLNNGTDDVVIKGPTGLIIDKITYFDSWYRDEVKKQGGYTLELINPNHPCSDGNNWIASNDENGGTPGIQNSVYDTTPNNAALQILETRALDSNLLEVNFNRGLDSLSVFYATYNFTPTLTLDAITVSETFPSKVLYEFQENLVPSQMYQFTIENIQDCWMNNTNLNGQFILPEEVALGDLIINEILFNPITGGSDFVEIRNNSNKVVDLKNLYLANIKNGEIGNHKQIPVHFMLHPNELAVVTADTLSQIQTYPMSVPGRFIQMSLPTYNNDSSTVFLLKDSITVLDRVSYSAKWHLKLIADVKAKSLEKIDPFGSSSDQKNWHTAAEAIGFATPGAANSQYSPAQHNGNFSLTSETVSPDNDGFEDVLQINYVMEQEGMVASVKIFDDRGRLIKHLCKNELLGMEGSLIWDGITESNQKASIGTYVVIFEAFKTNGGDLFVQKKAFVVAGNI